MCIVMLDPQVDSGGGCGNLYALGRPGLAAVVQPRPTVEVGIDPPPPLCWIDCEMVRIRSSLSPCLYLLCCCPGPEDL